MTLPDVLTELDLLAPLADPSLLLSQPFDDDILDRPDANLLDFGSSQRLTSSFQRARRVSVQPFGLEEDIGLDLDLGDDVRSPSVRERDIEVGRDAPPPRTLAEDFDDTMKLYDDDLGLDLGLDDTVPAFRRESTVLPEIGHTDLGHDIVMQGMEDDLGFQVPEDNLEVPSAPLQQTRPARDSLSPLSSIRSSVERDLERTFQEGQEPSVVDADEISVHHAQRAKRRKVLPLDAETELRSNQIRAQQNDRSKILKPASFIPRDPLLLALMEMQRNGEFVSNILSDGRSKGWAPELRGILSLEIVRTPLKRKRETNVTKQTRQPTDPSPEAPQIQLPSELGDDLGLEAEELTFAGANTSLDGGEEMLQLPNDDLTPLPALEPSELPRSSPSTSTRDHSSAEPPVPFDETLPPFVHPTDSGPISVGTKHAVHLLRERFGPAAEHSSSERAKASVLFQDLLPEKRTTRADATKMFFEVLVLATKDAIKVEQGADVVGSELKVRGKRGLWGAWAEKGAGGEIEAQEDEGLVAAAATA